MIFLFLFRVAIFAHILDGLGKSERQNERQKNARGADRFEIFGSACFELFNPGDYYASSKPAIYIRWLLNFRF